MKNVVNSSEEEDVAKVSGEADTDKADDLEAEADMAAVAAVAEGRLIGTK